MGLGPIQTCQSEPGRESDPWGLDCEETTLASRGQKRDFLGNKFNWSFLFPYIKQNKTKQKPLIAFQRNIVNFDIGGTVCRRTHFNF